MEASVYDIKGKDTGVKVKLNETVFGLEPNEHAMYLDVKEIMAKARTGNHKAKERNEVAGSTRKIKKQKGTGTARAGSIKNPLFVGGGRVFGPRVRSYDIKINKKVKQLAKRSALSSKVKENQLTVVEDFTLETPKTKSYIAFLKSFEAYGQNSLLVTAGDNGNILLSSRNVPKVSLQTIEQLNTYEIMKAKKVFITKGAVEALDKKLA